MANSQVSERMSDDAGRSGSEDFCPHVCRIGEDAGLDLDGAGYE